MAENFFGLTDTGKQRTNNEDTFIAEKSANGKYIIAGVIDGVGGYAGGEIAAAIARDTMIEQINASKFDVQSTLLTAFQKANDKIFAERQRDKQHDSMACVSTVAMVDVQNNQFYFAHIGDTRLYLFRDGTLVKISSDHSFVGFLEESGRLTEEAAMRHPKRNEINKALGFEPDIRNQQNYIETGSSPFLPGDTLLVCSDGLTDMVNARDISDILAPANSSLKETGKNLIELANHNGGEDNITVVLVKNDKKPATQDGIMPSTDLKKKPEPVVEPVTVPVKENQVIEVEDERPKKKKRRSGLLFFIALILLIAVAAIFYYQNSRFGSAPQNASDTPPVKDTTAVKPKGPSAEQVKLQQMLDGLKSDTLKLADTAFKTPIVLSSTIQINKDTLYIKPIGNVMFKADTGFKGPAFAIKNGAKIITFTHLHFDGFKTAITAYNNSLILRGVSFANSETPVQISFTPQANIAITGWLPADAFRTDSTSQAPKKK